MAKEEYPTTPAVRVLREHGCAIVPHRYPYEEHGGTRHAAACLGVDEHHIIKTLVMQNDSGQALIILMHGDCEVSTKQLARALGSKSVAPCAPQVVQKQTGYIVGGVSPFGTRNALPIYSEASILALERIYINAGKRGFLVELAPGEVERILAPQPVNVAIPRGSDA